MCHWSKYYLWVMMKVFQLLKKDFIIDWRQQNPLTGIVLYLASTLFTTYLAFQGFVSLEVWNALFWIILLFTSINAISKSFIQEERRAYYYFFTCTPLQIMLAKLIYSFTFLSLIGLISVGGFILLLGNPISNYGLFFLNIILGILGLSSAFTMVSAISFRANNRTIMMAVLGFPIILPVLILAVRNGHHILNGYIWMQVQGNILSLLSVDVIIIVLSNILFPFIWKS